MSILFRLHPLFPYLGHYEVTNSYVWRLALRLQLELADRDRSGTLGHYYEFGVYDMSSVKRFHQIKSFYGLFKKRLRDIGIVAFDSFEGYPQPTEADDYDPINAAGTYAFSLDAAREVARKKGIRQIRFVKGFYEDVLTDALADELADTPPAIINIDCDYYSSTLCVLRWLDSLALPGATYYFNYPWRFHGHPDTGVLRAIKEYNADAAGRGLLVEHPISVGSRKVYAFCPRDPDECIDFDAGRLPIRRLTAS